MRGEKGTTTVEFAIVGALAITLLLAVAEIGRALFAWNTITEATRRGARVAAVCPPGHAGITATTIFADVHAAAPSSPVLKGLTTDQVHVRYRDQAGNETAAFGEIQFVSVGIEGYHHTLLIPFVGAELEMPAFETTVPAESLGYIPETNTRSCF